MRRYLYTTLVGEFVASQWFPTKQQALTYLEELENGANDMFLIWEEAAPMKSVLNRKKDDWI